MTRKSSWPTKIMDNASHSCSTMFVILIKITKCSLNIKIREKCWISMTRPSNKKSFLFVSLCYEIEVKIDKIYTRNSSPMTENTSFYMFFCQWFFEKKIITEIKFCCSNIIGESKKTLTRIEIFERARHSHQMIK